VIRNRQLTNAIALHTAAIDKSLVYVYIDNELMGIGIITEITEFIVKIDNQYFARGMCEFWTEK
jgi:hypothetical protein